MHVFEVIAMVINAREVELEILWMGSSCVPGAETATGMARAATRGRGRKRDSTLSD
jgi:hypothetical protein